MRRFDPTGARVRPAPITEASQRLADLTELEWIDGAGGGGGGAGAPASRRFAAPEHPLMFLNRAGKSRNLSRLERERMHRWMRNLLSGG
jgi:hypothetical protein